MVERYVDFSLIRLYSQRLGYLTGQLIDAQKMTGQVGDDEAPWEAAFQRRAAEEFATRLPHSYMSDRTAAFRACVQEMDRTRDVPAALDPDWQIVRSYLFNLAEALEAELQLQKRSFPGDVAGESPTTPSIIRVDELAPLASPSALVRQAEAAAAVADFALRQRYGGITSTEVDWIRSLAREVSVVDIAAEYGYSERSMHRRFNDLWEKMNVEGRTEAIVVAASVGWLERPGTPASLVSGAGVGHV